MIEPEFVFGISSWPFVFLNLIVFVFYRLTVFGVTMEASVMTISSDDNEFS